MDLINEYAKKILDVIGDKKSRGCSKRIY